MDPKTHKNKLMKNIHILPTDKPSVPSRLFYNNKKTLVFNKEYYVFNGVNIYITNDEEIKDGDWYLDTFNTQRIKADQFSDHKHYGNVCKKIILTTDQDLIKDGIQEITDEFLEWFVQTPACEFIEVKKVKWILNSEYLVYEIIIPKEEPKQSIKDKILSETPESVIQKVRETTNDLVKSKQTLEEASEYFAHNNFNMHDTNNYKALKQGFEQGAKWQAERRYSEEDMIEFAVWMYLEVGQNSGKERTNKELFKEWFEQFKKK